MFGSKKTELPAPNDTLAGRPDPIESPDTHWVNGNTIKPPFPDGIEVAQFAMGCFWGAERVFWQTPGVYSTAVGYSGGTTPNPSYQEVCSAMTGHTEAVFVAFDPATVPYEDLLAVFWEAHDPTQGMRQGNDVGTQYRSAIYTYGEDQQRLAEKTAEMFQAGLNDAGYGAITTEIAPAGEFYYAEDYHQQYLAKNPNGYCGIKGTGVSCPIGG